MPVNPSACPSKSRLLTPFLVSHSLPSFFLLAFLPSWSWSSFREAVDGLWVWSPDRIQDAQLNSDVRWTTEIAWASSIVSMLKIIYCVLVSVVHIEPDTLYFYLLNLANLPARSLMSSALNIVKFLKISDTWMLFSISILTQIVLHFTFL